ncbi:MAG: NAD(P)H-dependent oxidoreductase subunit E [Candidatus Aenigmatarchaeota archaeon]
MAKRVLILNKYCAGEVPLIEVFEEIVKQEGCLSKERLEELSSALDIPMAKLYSTASFYSFLPTRDKGKYIIRVCNSPSCCLNGSRELLEFIKKELKVELGEVTKDGKFSVVKSECMGACDRAPAMMINDRLYTNLTKPKIREILRSLK